MRIDDTSHTLPQRALKGRAAISRQPEVGPTVRVSGDVPTLEARIPDQLGPGIVDLDVCGETSVHIGLWIEAAGSAGAAIELHVGTILDSHGPARTQAPPAPARPCSLFHGKTHRATPHIGPPAWEKKWRKRPGPPTFAGIDVALQQGSRALAEEIAALIESLDFDALVPEVVHAQVESLSRRLKSMTRRAAADEDLAKLLEMLKATLAEYTPDANTWEALRSDLTEAYEGLTCILTADDPEKPARPINYTRSVFHAGCGVVALVLALALLPLHQLVWVAGVFAAWGWSAEIARRVSPRANAILMRGFKHVAHPSEWNRVNSATWYTSALFGLTLTESVSLMVVPVAVLAFGDPAAGILGRKFGRRPLVNGRSLEGTSAFVLVGTLAGALALTLARPELGLLPVFAVSFAAGLCGALAELFSRSIDDNLSVPVAALVGTFVALQLFGIAL